VGTEIRKALRRFAPTLLEARKLELNEADTVVRICRFCEEVLGYDGLADVSREVNLKNKYVDVCLKVDGRVRLLVECKAASATLRERHIEQAQAYASQNNFRWVVLTNGVDWQLYHLTFDQGIEYEKAFAVSLSSDAGIEDAAEKLALLHHSSIRRGALDQYWEKATVLSPHSIARALFRDSVIMLLRRELRRESGLLIDPEDLGASLHAMLSQEARDQVGPMKIRRSRRSSVKSSGGRGAGKQASLASDPVVAPGQPASAGKEA
jgi:hypothetical protein